MHRQHWMQESNVLGYFLDSVNAAAVAVMLAILIFMAKDTLMDWRSIVIAVLSFFLTFGT